IAAVLKPRSRSVRDNFSIPHLVLPKINTLSNPGLIKRSWSTSIFCLPVNRTIYCSIFSAVSCCFTDTVTGFVTKLRRISCVFSATVDGKTQDILRSFVTNPVTVSVKQQDTAENIEQDIVRLSGNRPKIDVLHDLLIQPGFDKVLIFGRTKWGMEKLSKILVERGFRTAAIHGNKSQNQRQRVLD